LLNIVVSSNEKAKDDRMINKTDSPQFANKEISTNIETDNKVVIENPDVRVVEKDRLFKAISKKNKAVIAITGATGLLGSNLLYEIINYYFDSIDNLSIIIFGRSTKDFSLYDRIYNSIFKENNGYLEVSFKNKDNKNNFIKNNITFIDYDLKKDNLGLSKKDLSILKKTKIDVIFHAAALTDLRLTKSVEKNVIQTNYYGTKRFLNFIEKEKISIKEFIYISTAYACGDKNGNISPDYTNIKGNFHNIYEYSKLLGEIATRDFAKRTGIKIKIARTSVLSGRLIDGNLGAVNKFDVFYQVWLFFLQLKKKATGYSLDTIRDKNWNINFRLYFSDGSLNIVPVDYVTKLLFHYWYSSSNIECLHLTNPYSTPNSLYAMEIIKNIGITGVTPVSSEPENKNEYEKIYYAYCGKIFYPYISINNTNFETTLTNLISEKYNIHCPSLNATHLSILFNYAFKNYLLMSKK
jgi:nucleoside-diphosphate-sugar epimerase